MPVSFGLALLVLAQSRSATLGRSDAQILAMGRKGWTAFYASREGDSTASMSGAQALYGDALAARNDHLMKGANASLRRALVAFAEDAQGVGYALTGGGTMWNVAAGSYYADAEETLYAVLTHTRRGPRVRVSEARAAVERLRRRLARLDPKSQDASEGREEMQKLEGRFRVLVGQTSRLDRNGSDTVLNFCRATVANVVAMAP